MNRPVVSIIIPVYKTEKYIRDTLFSLYSQDDCDISFEVIVVNDGTPDSAMSIVYEYVDEYDNIYVIEQDNKGLSVARNEGLRLAKGDYVWFVDSDDTIASNALKNIGNITTFTDSDVFFTDMNVVDETSRDTRISSVFWHKRDYPKYGRMMNGCKLEGIINETPVQRCIYKRSFLKDYGIFFTPGYFHEDNDFQFRVLMNAKKVYVSNLIIYNYLERSYGSITSDFKIKRIYDKEAISSKCSEKAKERGLSMLQRSMLYDYSNKMIISIFSEKTKDNGYLSYLSEYHFYYFRRAVLTALLSSINHFRFGKLIRSLCLINISLFRKYFV